MKAILRKGVAACAAMLMGANVMAQEDVFVENSGVKFSTECYFLSQEMTSDGKSRLILPITETIEIDEGYGTYTYSFTTGWQVVDKNLNVEKEFKMFTPDELNNTREIIYETSDGNGGWTEISKETREIYLPYFQYRSVDCNYTSLTTISQTLFNDDDKYEAFVPVYGGEVIFQEGNDRRIYKNYVVTSLKIVSETGETLHTLYAGDNMFFACGEGSDNQQVIRIDDKIYFAVRVGNLVADNFEWVYGDSYRWYEICKETSSINFVRETRAAMNISPTIADRDAQITITLNEESGNVARELIVTSVNGQLVERRDIPAGESSVQIPASMLRSGMYNFTLQKKGQVVDNGKVIVK